MLAGMSWRRGILLAAISLAAAIPTMVLLEMRDAQYVKEIEGEGRSTLTRPERLGFLRVDQEETIALYPCTMWVDDAFPAQMSVVESGNLPAFTVAGWRQDCPPTWTISGMIRGTGFMNRARLVAQRRVDLVLCGLIAVQWVMVGGFPLTKKRRVWQGPGSLITVCTVIGSLLALVHSIDGLARLPALVAGCAWFWWVGLVVWKAVSILVLGRSGLGQFWKRSCTF